MVWNLLPDSLCDLSIESEHFRSEHFRRDLERISLLDIRDMRALEVSPFHGNVLYKLTFLFTYLLTIKGNNIAASYVNKFM